MKPARLLARIRRGELSNVQFADLVNLVEALGFREAGGRGSHRVFVHPSVAELINLQEERGQASDIKCGRWRALSSGTLSISRRSRER